MAEMVGIIPVVEQLISAIKDHNALMTLLIEKISGFSTLFGLLCMTTGLMAGALIGMSITIPMVLQNLRAKENKCKKDNSAGLGLPPLIDDDNDVVI